MKKYKTNDLYVVQLHVVASSEFVNNGVLTTSKFLDFVIVKYDEEKMCEKYIDVITGKSYLGYMRTQGEIFINPKSLINLNKLTKKEKLTIKEIKEILNIVRSETTTERQKAEQRRKIIGQIVENLTKELGEEKTYMLLNQIVDELGIEKTQEITNPLSNELGYNVVEKAKNIERTRKK